MKYWKRPTKAEKVILKARESKNEKIMIFFHFLWSLGIRITKNLVIRESTWPFSDFSESFYDADLYFEVRLKGYIRIAALSIPLNIFSYTFKTNVSKSKHCALELTKNETLRTPNFSTVTVLHLFLNFNYNLCRFWYQQDTVGWGEIR